jgi:hypothetical protein
LEDKMQYFSTLMLSLGLGLGCQDAAEDCKEGTHRVGHVCMEDTVSDPVLDENLEPADTIPLEYFSINGQLVDFETKEALGKGLCVDAINAKRLKKTGALSSLASTTTKPDGSFRLFDLEVTTQGVLLGVRECNKKVPALYPTVLKIRPSKLDEMTDSRFLNGVVIPVLTTSYVNQMAQSLSQADAVFALKTNGFLAGYIVNSEGAPAGRSTIDCGGCDVFYVDENPEDGLFTEVLEEGIALNNFAIAPAGSIFLIPDPPDGEIDVIKGEAKFDRAAHSTFKAWATTHIYKSHGSGLDLTDDEPPPATYID